MGSLTNLMESYTREIVQKLALKYGFSAEEALTVLNINTVKAKKEKPAAKPVVAEPVVAEPVVAKPVVAKPVVAEPVVAEPVVAKPAAFTAKQVALMDDEELLANFTQVTGKIHLACKHCHCEKVELTFFTRVIRKWCFKKSNNGMNKEMSVPRTCDHQSVVNLNRQPYYTKIRNAVSEENSTMIKANHSHLFVERRKGRIN
jgi:hypothetical protein